MNPHPSPPNDPLSPSPFEPERSIGLQLRRITALLGSEVDRRMEPLGLTNAQWKPLLRLLLGTPGTTAALARDCHADAGGLTRLLDRLESKGLCRRERSQADRRVVHIALTPEGHAAAAQLPAILGGVQQQLLQGFSPQEEALLRDYLARLYANAQALADPTPDTDSP